MPPFYRREIAIWLQPQASAAARAAPVGIVEKIARCWIVCAGAIFLIDLLRQTTNGLTNAQGRPFGDDFINFWSGAVLAFQNHVAVVYDMPAFHHFQQSIVGPTLDYYQYGYPPVTLVLTAPLALFPYIPGLALWLVAGWLCFYRALRLAMPGRNALFLALATPAVFINMIGGQNGTWTAAILGGGLCLLERRPFLAGTLFGCLICKPQLGVLIPLALLAGREWRAFAAASLSAAAIILLSLVLFGPETWVAYLHQATIFRHDILETGAHTWHRLVSVFIFSRRLGADIPLAYLTQAISALIVAAFVALLWFRKARAELRYAALMLGTCLATPYLQDYDLVMGAFVVAWLTKDGLPPRLREPALIASALLLLIPFLSSALAKATGLAFGPLFILPALAVTLRAAFPETRNSALA